MYSVETLLSGIKNQFNILKHLWEKIHEENINFTITEWSRTVLELLKYLCFSTPVQVEIMVDGKMDMEKYNASLAKWENFTYDQFSTELDKAYAHIEAQIKSVTEEQRTEVINVFYQTAPRNTFLVNYLLVFLGAYKTQLFLQLKAAGNKDLGTWNLWAGMDEPKK